MPKKEKLQIKLKCPKFICRYPKFWILFLTIIVATIIFSSKAIIEYDHTIRNYLAAFTLGVLYVYGFTAAFATGGLLILASDTNIFWAGIAGGLGSIIGDLIIFKFVRSSFNDEIAYLTKTKLFKKIKELIKNHGTLNNFVPFIAYFFIASPLPDEVGVTLLATYRNVTTKTFAIFAYILNTIGILTILVIGKIF